jgi:hypothetical protein
MLAKGYQPWGGCGECIFPKEKLIETISTVTETKVPTWDGRCKALLSEVGKYMDESVNNFS